MAGIAVNMLLCAVKGGAGYLGNSYVLIADAIESLTDVASSCIVLMALSIAARPPDPRYPYGRGRLESLSAVAVAAILILAAALIAAESIRQIMTPHLVPAPFTLIILIGVLVTKEVLFRWVIKVGTDLGSTAIKADAWHHRSDALTSLAAFLGISIALLGGPGYEAADDWAALFASALIVFNAISILRPAMEEMLDRSPDTSVTDEIRRLAATVDGVLGTHKCHVRKLGLEFFVDLDVIVAADMTVRDSHRIAHIVQDLIRNEMPVVSKVLVHIEPPKSER